MLATYKCFFLVKFAFIKLMDDFFQAFFKVLNLSNFQNLNIFVKIIIVLTNINEDFFAII